MAWQEITKAEKEAECGGLGRTTIHDEDEQLEYLTTKHNLSQPPRAKIMKDKEIQTTHDIGENVSTQTDPLSAPVVKKATIYYEAGTQTSDLMNSDFPTASTTKKSEISTSPSTPRRLNSPGWWNCGELDHFYTTCQKHFTRIFCFHCGEIDYRTQEYPTCDGKYVVESYYFNRPDHLYRPNRNGRDQPKN